MKHRGKSRKTSRWQLVLLALMLVQCGTILAQEAESADEEGNVELDKISVVGSHIKRTDLEGPAPVYIIDQEMMSKRGFVTVSEALDSLAINNGFMFEGPEAASFTPDVQTINLRSFGVGQTLVLVNGRRLTNYPAAYQSQSTVFNFGAIPVVAVERIEVLATGASAIYGSDAIAGVVNIVLRSDIDGNTVNLLWGTPTETKNTRDDIRLQFMHGQTFLKSSYTLTFEYTKRDALKGNNYNKYDEETDYPFQNVPGVDPAIPNRQILYYDYWKNFYAPAGWYIDPVENGGCPGPEGVLTLEYRDPHGNFCGHNTIKDWNFRNDRESFSVYANGKLEVGSSGTELFADVLYYTSESTSNNGSLYIFEDILDLTTPDSVGVGFYDWRYSQRGFTEEELGISLDEKFEDDALTISAGARGTFRDVHDWEFSYTYSKYKYKQALPFFKWREVVDSMLGVYIAPSYFGDPWWSAGTLGEPLGFPLGGAGTFAEVNAAVLNAIGDHRYGNKSTDNFLSFTMTGDLVEMASGPLAYALVLEYEDSDFKYVPDALLLQSAPETDAFGDPITQNLIGSGWYKLTGYNGGGDRQRWALGAELRVPVTSNLTLNLAARYDDYDSGSTSFGGDLTPSASLEYRPLSNLLLRAGYTESFRAPDMALVFVDTGFFQQGLDIVSCWEAYNFQNPGGELTAQEFDASGLIRSECEATWEFARRTGAQNLGEGEKPLDAETGNSWWVGFSWDILDNLTLQADYVHMELEDRVVTPTLTQQLDDEWQCRLGTLPQADCDANALRVQREVDPTTGFSYIQNILVTPFNSSLLEADSLDARIVWNLNTRAGIFGFTGDYSLIVNLDEREVKGGEKVNLRDDPSAGGWDFRSNFIGTISHSYADYSQTWTVIYRGGTVTWNQYSVIDGRDMWYEPGTKERVDAWITWNWTGQYNFTDDLLGRIRVLNVFDEGPPKDETFPWYTQPWFNYFVYSGGAIGRQVYAELQFTF